MLSADSIAGIPSTSGTQVSRERLNPEDQDIWFDAIDHVEVEDKWFEGAEAFDTHEEHQADPSSSAGEAADSRVPFTEDCRRGVQQFVRTLGEYGESKMLSACLSKILPGTPASLVIAANSLYTAVTERRNIDTAALHALGLASWYLPENINVVSPLASFIQDTVTGWTDETFLQQFLGNEDNHTSIHLFTALAVTAIVAGRWMKDEGAPQRGVLKVPAFMANIFIRASHFWTALGNMAGSLPPGAEIPENTGISQHAHAFEVDTQIEMTGDICDATAPCSSAPPRLTAFSSNSTARPEAYIRATVQNRPAPAPAPGNNSPQLAHYLALEKLGQANDLTDLLYCATSKTESLQQTNKGVITYTHFNTKCDAIGEMTPPDEPVSGSGLMNIKQDVSHSTSHQVKQSPAHLATGGQSPSCVSAQPETKLSDYFNPVIRTVTGTLGWIDKQLTFPGAEATISPPPATTPQAEFSAKEFRLLKRLATDTEGRNTLSVPNNQKNIYGNGTIYVISDSDGTFSKSTTDTVVIAGMYIPVTTDTLPVYGLRYSIMAEGHKYPLQWSEAQGWTFDRQNPTYSTLDRLPEQNAAVAQLLRNTGIYNTPVNTEELLYKTAIYVSSRFTCEKEDAKCQDKKKEVVRAILGASGYYGGGKNENISNVQTDRILNSWFIDNLFHDSLNEYVADEARGDSDMNLGKLRGVLSLASLQKKDIFSLNKVPVTYRSEFDAYLEARIRDAFPLLHMTGNDDLSLQDPEFAFLYAGSKWLFDTSNATHLEEYSHNEIKEIGRNLWVEAQENGIPSDYLPLLELPSMIKNSGPVLTFSERLNAVSLYAENIKLFNIAMQGLQDLFGTYKHKLSEWMGRGNLADKVIDDCEPEYLSSVRNKRATDGKISQHEVNEWEDRKQAYLNGLAKPCAGAPESLNDEYTRLTGQVVDSYKNIDSILLGAALGNVRDNDKDFISHSDAFIRPVNYALGGYSMSAGPAGVGVSWMNIPLKKNVDLFAVELKGEKRFYAFKNDNAGDSFGNYSIVNLGDGSSVAPFCENGLLELDLSKGYTINGKELKIQNAPHPFTLDITPDNGNNICTGNKAYELVDYIAGKHRDHFFSNMYEHGYDKSNIEKLWGFIKGIVPGLNCYSLVRKNIEHPSTDNLAGAISGCVWDSVALLPIAGGITRLSQKFGMSAVQGIMKSAGRNIISSATRGASLPSLGELKALGVSALRALDPGIEVSGLLGKWSIKRLSDRLVRQGNKVLGGKITKNLNTKDLQPRDVQSDTITLPLSSSGVGLPVKRIPQKNGHDIYVAVNPETGELWGRKYGVYAGELVDADFIPPVVGGVKVRMSVPAELQQDMAELRRYIAELNAGTCGVSAARPKRSPPEAVCAPLRLSTPALLRILDYATVDELSVLAQNQDYRDSVFRTVNEAASSHPESADRLIESIGIAAENSGDTNLLSTIVRVDSDIQQALVRFQEKFVKKTEMGIESPRVLGTHAFHGYNPDPNISSQGVHASYTAIDTDNFVRRLNIVMHGEPGGVFLNGNTRINADELYHSLYEHGIFDQDFTEIRMLVCSSADGTPNGGISVAERLSQLTGKPVEGFKGTMTMYETFNIGGYISIPSVNMVNDAFLQGGNFGATEFMYNNRDYISIGVHPFPNVPNKSETFYPFGDASN